MDCGSYSDCHYRRVHLFEQSKEKDNRLKESNIIESRLQNDGFTIDKRLPVCCYVGVSFIDLLVDTKSKRLAVCNYYIKNYVTIDFQDIVECEVIENGNPIAKGTVGRAIVGGVLAGGVGAIIGASTHKTKTAISELYIRITRNDITNPQYLLPFMVKDKTMLKGSRSIKTMIDRKPL